MAETSHTGEGPARGTAGLGPGGIDRVLLRFEGPIPAPLTALAESDLRTAFGRRGVEVLRREAGSSAPGAAAGNGVVLTIAIANERLEQVALKIEEKSEGASASASSEGAAPIAFTLGRRLDLNAFPPDGRMLALVVAADEMLVAAATEHWRRVRGSPRGGEESPLPSAVEAEAAAPDGNVDPSTAAPPPQAAPQPAATAATTKKTTTIAAEVAQKRAPDEDRGVPLPRREDGLAATFAFDHFGGGQTQLGVDLAWRRRLGPQWHASLAAQGRQGLTVTASTGTVDSRLLGGRVALGRTLADDGGRLWLTVDLGARAGHLRYEGRGTGPDGRRMDHQVATFFGYVDATLSLDVRLGRSPLAVRLAAGAGLPLLAQDAAAGDTVVTGASGAALESQAGLALTF